MVQRKSPIDAFFSLGDKVTGGDPVRKAKFDYYLMWIIFLGFILILYSNIMAFIASRDLKFLGWAAVVGAILWFQYGSMKMAKQAKDMMEKQDAGVDYNKVDDVEDMFDFKEDGVEVIKDVGDDNDFEVVKVAKPKRKKKNANKK